ncbi:non-specific lipid transfer protein GPI-anchored 5 [Arachis duranensis]|uniref:Non-specific lipid transfer protein GPI-anchored 5 n=1 Tax=Arachis duranensis TaxID=130453 RepID=A0A6P4DA21_ARADU|nr:non-specific lipid transfer protein GPI-anchored 5 [Arachis duranensis]
MHQTITMEHRISKMSFAMVVMAMLCAGAAAQSSSCTNVIVSLSPCLNYITGNSSTPSSGCCSQLSSVLGSQPQCLCQVLNGGGSSLGININQTQALALPSACKLGKTPSVSQCKASSPSPANSPAGSATGTGTGTAAESPNSPTTDSSGSGSKSVPTTDSGSSSANSVKLSVPLFLTLAVIYASAFRTY